jgi:hypothetical protein
VLLQHLVEAAGGLSELGWADVSSVPITYPNRHFLGADDGIRTRDPHLGNSKCTLESTGHLTILSVQKRNYFRTALWRSAEHCAVVARVWHNDDPHTRHCPHLRSLLPILPLKFQCGIRTAARVRSPIFLVVPRALSHLLENRVDLIPVEGARVESGAQPPQVSQCAERVIESTASSAVLGRARVLAV